MFAGCLPSHNSCTNVIESSPVQDLDDDDELLHEETDSDSTSWLNGIEVPWGKVLDVHAASPAAAAGMHEGDIVFQFGHLTALGYAESLGLTDTHTITPLRLNTTFPSLTKALSSFVRSCDGVMIPVDVLRKHEGESQRLKLEVAPKRWGAGRGLLGCNIRVLDTNDMMLHVQRVSEHDKEELDELEDDYWMAAAPPAATPSKIAAPLQPLPPPCSPPPLPPSLLPDFEPHDAGTSAFLWPPHQDILLAT
jgi:hypothetical protein